MNVSNKIAIIFHGIAGGMDGHNGVGLPINVSDCAKTIKRSILSVYDCDVFIHSWSTEFEKEITSLYSPTASLFQPQEYFGFNIDQTLNHPKLGQAFRTISRYTSLERAINLKIAHELNNNFKYDWVIVIRFDLVFFNILNISKCDNALFYGCFIPEWNHIHDLFFMSNSLNMDIFSRLSTEIHSGQYNPSNAHELVVNKLMRMFNGNTRMFLNYAVKRYEDVEIYRWIIQQDQLRPEGKLLGSLELKARLEKLLKEIDEGVK